MKKSLLALAVLGAFAGTAAAQVTVYGIVDAGYGTRDTKIDGVDTAESRGMQSAILGSPRFGVRGSEDLGNGLKGIFQLEAAVNLTGDSATFGGAARNKFVGLEGGFGRVTLGRDTNPFHNIAAAYDVDGRNDFSTTAGNNAFSYAGTGFGLYSGTFRSNAITYTSPNFGGVTVRGQLSDEKSENPSTVTGTKSRQFALAATYANGPLSVGAAFEQRTAESIATGQDTTDIDSFLVGASYDFQVAKVFANAGQAKFDVHSINLGGTPPVTVAVDGEKYREYNLGVSVPVGAFTVVAGVGRNEIRGAGFKDTGTDYNVGANYNLSKRTFVYGRVAQFDTLKVDGLKSAQSGAQIGVRHSF